MSKTAPLRLGILAVDRTPQALRAAHGSMPEMITGWLNVPEAHVTCYQADDGVLPASPDAADFWIISGSPAGVYEDLPWIPPLETFVRTCHTARTPMFGICFGHQLIAQALGGQVRKSSKGWGLGVQECAITSWPDQLGPAPDHISLQSFHQDQVEEPPEAAAVIAASSFCRTAVLWYSGWALTVQGHPEFSRAFNSDLIMSYENRVLGKALARTGFEKAQNDDNRDELARIVRNWLTKLTKKEL